uniref:RBR-type E3 ubiquitin transferase n=1 Tax=Enterobius vermicularis TaxID=51028 RepID=A0A0N4V7Y3_ENTVE
LDCCECCFICFRYIFNSYNFINRYPERSVNYYAKAEETEFDRQKLFAEVRQIYLDDEASISPCSSKKDYDCELVIGRDQMMAVLPLDFCYRCETLTKEKLLMKALEKSYRSFKCEICKTVNEIRSEEMNNVLAQCSCGYTVCSKCLNEAHLPLTCDDARKYREFRSVNGQPPINIKVRQCPHCNAYFQRSGGCNNITCTCGTQFCYICCQEWGDSHKNCVDAGQVSIYNVLRAEEIENV